MSRIGAVLPCFRCGSFLFAKAILYSQVSGKLYKSYYRIRRLSDELCGEHGLSIISPGEQHGKNTRNGSFVRGSVKSLGAEYTKERIKERIGEKVLIRDKKRVPFPVRKKPIVKDYSKKNLIDTTSYSQAGSIAELEQQIAAKSTLAKTARESLVETELILHDGAENMLKRMGINPKEVDVEKLRNDYNTLYSKKQTLQKTYKSAEKESADLNRKLDNLNQYLDRTPEPPQSTDRKTDKGINSL